MVTLQDYKGITPTWCPGCGNFGILQALNKALVNLGIEPHRLLMVSGIGQAGKLPHYSRGNVFNSLHGRAMPVAIGAKLANPELTVLVMGGDGDGYGEGGNHFLHSMRRNHDITCMVHNNQVYGLTKGQASPTSDEGFITKSTPEGAPQPMNAIGFSILNGATFVARGFAGDIDHLAGLIEAGIKHKGFSHIDILQPCVSFNHKNTFRWYQERIYKLQEDYDPTDKHQALVKSEEWGDKIPIGVIYNIERAGYEEKQALLAKGPLVKQDIHPIGVEGLLAEFR